MANASTTGFGLRMVMNVGNTPATSGQSEYKIQTAPGVASNKGDPMSFNDGGAAAGEAGKVQDASFTVTDDGGNGGTAWTTANSALLLGVFNGAFFINSNGKPTFSNNVVASQATSTDYNTGSNDILAFINDNPQQEYNIRANDSWTQADVGTSFNTGSNGATGISGMSDERLGVDAAAAATKALTLLRNANVPDQMDPTVGGCDVVVVINKASALFN